MKIPSEENIEAVFSELKQQAKLEHEEHVPGVQCELCRISNHFDQVHLDSNHEKICCLDTFAVGIIGNMAAGIFIMVSPDDTEEIIRLTRLAFLVGLKIGRAQAFEESTELLIK